jgi:hypothetical protein
MAKQAKFSDLRKRGRPKTIETKLCVSLNARQFKAVKQAAKFNGVTHPEALRRLAFLGMWKEEA